MSNARTFSRRRFAQSLAIASAAPFILPSRIWSAETPPNDKITLGFIGMGTQNRGLLNGFINRPEVQVAAVCEVDGARLANAQKIVQDHYSKKNEKDYKGCAAYKDFRELNARKDIDAVVIATPDHWHALMAIYAANQGKDIYCEKPLTQSIHEARALVNAVRRKERVFQTGSMQRSSTEFRQACELVRNGRLGKLQRVEVAISGPAKWCDLEEKEAPPELDWNMWLGPAPKRGWNEILSPRGVHSHYPAWRNYREYGGGGVTDWGAHHFDIVQWALGMDESGPSEIVAPGSEDARSGVKVIYPNGVEMLHTEGNGITFFGSNGKVYVNRGKIDVDPPKLAEKPIGEQEVRLYKSNDHLGDWLSCIRSRKKPIADVEVGARTVTICHLVNLAYYHNASLKWDPAKEQFINGSGDPKWLDVPYREPWVLPA
ncbi:MAG: Gfo/Idh/MocA family protein [Verrucomicrobiales bacterium]